MSSIQIKRPVTIKVIMTEAFRKQILDETSESLKKNEEMFAQAENMYQKTQKSGASEEDLTIIRKQLELERARLADIKKDMEVKMQAFKNVPEGQEIVFRILEGPVDVKEGDDIQKILHGAEIVVKDWKVTELRGL
jgi:5-bromo-4-chloroindolyl phosphate hydrolysis protein